MMCDAWIALGEHTADGATLFAKNSDRKSGEAQPFVQHPAAAHAQGSRVHCTHLEIPQVAETYGVMGHSPWWVWGFEHGVNEHAVACGNLAVFSKEPIEEVPGLIGMDLVRLGLERGRTARECLEIIAGLIETHGQGGSALEPGGAGYHNAFAIADPDEAWILETSNRHWAARRAGLDTCSNDMSLGSDWEIASKDLESFARSQGWWERDVRIDVADAYRNPHIPPQISEGRRRHSAELLLASDGKLDVRLMQAVTRDHGACGPTWKPGSDPSQEAHFTLCAHSEPVHWTTASMVVELPHDHEAPWPVWISFGTPCTGVFLPVYMDGPIAPGLARGGPEADPTSAWWTFKSLQDAVSTDPVARTPLVRQAFQEWEAQVETKRGLVEARARAAPDPDQRASTLANFSAWAVAGALKCAREVREQLG
jgi:dipeptidase